jgi:hypothetical protein
MQGQMLPFHTSLTISGGCCLCPFWQLVPSFRSPPRTLSQKYMNASLSTSESRLLLLIAFIAFFFFFDLT